MCVCDTDWTIKTIHSITELGHTDIHVSTYAIICQRCMGLCLLIYYWYGFSSTSTSKSLSSNMYIVALLIMYLYITQNSMKVFLDFYFVIRHVENPFGTILYSKDIFLSMAL